MDNYRLAVELISWTLGLARDVEEAMGLSGFVVREGEGPWIKGGWIVEAELTPKALRFFGRLWEVAELRGWQCTFQCNSHIALYMHRK